MADWRTLAKALALADGSIDERETQLIKREILADGKLDKNELEWLIEVRNGAQRVVDSFNEFFFDVLKKVILQDGEISDNEANWMSKLIFADGVVDEAEKKFVRELRTSARIVGPAFEALCKKVGV